MGRKNYLDPSYVLDIRGEWRRSVISEEALAWARTNLSRRDGEPNPHSGSFAKSTTVSTAPIDQDLSAGGTPKFQFKKGKVHPTVLLERGDSYYFFDGLSVAAEKSDPTGAPHIQFRMLTDGDDAGALLFLKNWGPLCDIRWRKSDLVLVDLNDFWYRHLWFVAVTKLFESLDEPLELIDTVKWWKDRKDSLRIAAAACTESGSSPFLAYIDSIDTYPDAVHLAGNRDSLQAVVADFLVFQFPQHTGGWRVASYAPRLSFRPVRTITSLWAALWEIFVLETQIGSGWRSCRICGKYFYPRQNNSRCCTPAHQALWSKRCWARRNRSQKLRKIEQIVGSGGQRDCEAPAKTSTSTKL
jgi:hypothetical protein